MPETKPTDDLEKLLSDLKSIEDRKQALIDDLLRQKAEAVKAFDDKLAKLDRLALPIAGLLNPGGRVVMVSSAGHRRADVGLRSRQRFRPLDLPSDQHSR